MEAYLQGQRISLDPDKSIGKGGEADVFDIGNGRAVKIFKTPGHPDYQGLPQEQQGAKVRIEEHQRKLREFPRGLPGRAVIPEELATDRSGNRIVGYSMRYLKGAEALFRYAEQSFRRGGVANDEVVRIFLDLHRTLSEVHRAKVVIGDFNDLNVLVRGTEAYIIDLDSSQFGKYLCKMFTAKFADPLLCDQRANESLLIRPHTEQSDWYAFAVMLMQSLLFVDPYGGVYRPKVKARIIPHGRRPLERITVFHPEVRYPKPAVPYGMLDDGLLQYFHRIFEKDQRGMFPAELIANLHWTKCVKCQTEHARNICPVCAQAAPAAVKEAIAIRGNVKATRIFRTSGTIVCATMQEGVLLWLYHENGEFRREDRSVVIKGPLDPGMRFRLKGKETLIGKDGQVVALKMDGEVERYAVDSFGTLPIFDANSQSVYWAKNGQLQRSGQFGPQYIGDVLPGQTLFWVGKEFGFGFYRAGNLNVAFTFDAGKAGIRDSVKLPPIRGQLLDSTCVFGPDRAWFFLATLEGGKAMHQAVLIRRNGTVEAAVKLEANEEAWLSKIRGKCAAGNFLLAATDEGIVRVEADNGKIRETRTFPDTEPFVDSGCHLFPGGDGVYAVNGKEVRHLKML